MEPEKLPVKWTTYAEGFKAYEDGKHRRYALFFSVNGAAFALVKLMAEPGSAILGKLTLAHVAIGMIVFSILMTVDIFAFGWKMSQHLDGVFSKFGWAVVVLIGLLLSAGWLFVIL